MVFHELEGGVTNEYIIKVVRAMMSPRYRKRVEDILSRIPNGSTTLMMYSLVTPPSSSRRFW